MMMAKWLCHLTTTVRLQCAGEVDASRRPRTLYSTRQCYAEQSHDAAAGEGSEPARLYRSIHLLQYIVLRSSHCGPAYLWMIG